MLPPFKLRLNEISLIVLHNLSINANDKTDDEYSNCEVIRDLMLASVFYELDLPEVMECRRELIPETECDRYLEGSLLDPSRLLAISLIRSAPVFLSSVYAGESFDAALWSPDSRLP